MLSKKRVLFKKPWRENKPRCASKNYEKMSVMTLTLPIKITKRHIFGEVKSYQIEVLGLFFTLLKG